MYYFCNDEIKYAVYYLLLGMPFQVCLTSYKTYKDYESLDFNLTTGINHYHCFVYEMQLHLHQEISLHY